MNRNIAFVLLACMLGSGIAGWWLGRHQASTGNDAFEAASSPAADGVGIATPPQAGSASAATGVPGELSIATTRARSDTGYLRSLIAQYGNSAHRDQRGAVLAILGSVSNDEVLRFATRLATSPDATERSDGITLLTGYPPDRPDVRQALLERLQLETDPGLQEKLLQNLPSAQLPSEDAAPIVAELERLQDSGNPKVRAASILQAVQWNRADDSGDLLQRALLDDAPEVRQAGIAGIQASGARTPLLRDALLDIASNPASSAAERQAAVVALQDFSLNRAEFEVYRQAAARIPQD